jgi:hypothetical protein
VVSLNRAIAGAMVHGPKAGLETLAPSIMTRIAGHYRLDAERQGATPTPSDDIRVESGRGVIGPHTVDCVMAKPAGLKQSSGVSWRERHE